MLKKSIMLHLGRALLMLLISLGLYHPIFCQDGKNGAVTAPSTLSASDGIYEKYVLIRWQPSENAQTYRVFRTTKVNKAPESLTKKWQQSTWLCDYTAQPGVDYFYAVVARNEVEQSPLTPFDKGFVKPSDAIATDKLSTTDVVYASPNANPLMVGAIILGNSQVKDGAVVDLTVSLENIANRDLDRPELRFFLSKDNQLSWDDQLLETKYFGPFLAQGNSQLNYEIKLTEVAITGTYYLIVVSSLEGDILNSRIGLIPIDIIK